MRRLFSNFAPGAPGFGLVLLRLATGSASINQGVTALIGGGSFAAAAFHSVWILLGVLLLVGLWTPIAGALAALAAIAEMISHPASRPQFGSIAIMAAALALLGPGAWSIDAWLYGWKEIRISGRPRQADSPD
jgi:putative oxidoreductase